jgi:hypothetical protein
MHIIDERLQQIECPLSLFVPIAGLVGRTRLTQFLQGTARLDANVVEKLVSVLDELIELKRASVIAPDWADAEKIREQLRVRREIKQAIEYDEFEVQKLLRQEDRDARYGS